MASRAPVALILRRGPSKWVEAIRWDLQTDRFERGEWFCGRIHEERSDLSPNGHLLVYLAARYSRESGKQVWTAVSRPPSFAPIALWPKDHTYYGGGLFLGDHRLLLNHPPDDALPQPGCEPASDLRVDANPKAHAEYVFWSRLERDGWDLRPELDADCESEDRKVARSAEELVRRPPGDGMPRIILQRAADGWFSLHRRFRLEGLSKEVELPPGPLDWLDWDSGKRLIALSGGRIWAANVDGNHVSRFDELLDVRHDRPDGQSMPLAGTS